MGWKVLTGAYVSRILFDEETQKSNDRTVTSVEFIHDGVKYEVKAEREVILSAGYVFGLLPSPVNKSTHYHHTGLLNLPKSSNYQGWVTPSCWRSTE